MPGPALLLDTYSLLFRAHHALPPMCTTCGEPTAALYGFCALLLKLVRQQSPVGLAFALDMPQRTFRKERFATTRLSASVCPTCWASKWAGSARSSMHSAYPRFARRASRQMTSLQHWRGDCVTADRPRCGEWRSRYLQTALAPVDVLFIGRRGKPAQRYDDASVRERFGVGPAELPAYVALVGDASDNLPGVHGVGPRTAAALVRTYGNISNLLAHLSAVEPDKLRRALQECAQQLSLCEDLARLRDDLPIAVPEGAEAAPVTDGGWQSVSKLFAELEFKSLLGRLPLQRSL